MRIAATFSCFASASVHAHHGADPAGGLTAWQMIAIALLVALVFLGARVLRWALRRAAAHTPAMPSSGPPRGAPVRRQQ